MMNRKFFMKGFSLILLFLFQFSFSQERVSVTGVVTSKEDGQPLPGVFVKVEGSKNGTATDFDGVYTIEVSRGDVLVFSYMGMKTQLIKVSEDSFSSGKLNVALLSDSESLDDVVVVGYGNQSKSRLVTSQTEVKGETLQSRGVTSVADALTALAPGLNITPNSSRGGLPGASMGINIRGYTSINGGDPLVLVDGIEQDHNTLDPNEIESVTVLRDVSATAVYGARGAFGVILIQTKGGKGSPTISYSSTVSMNTFRNLPKKLVGIEFAKAMNYALRNGGATSDKFNIAEIQAKVDKYGGYRTYLIPEDDFDKNGEIGWGEDGANPNIAVDQFDTYYNKASLMQNHSLTVGGSVKYGSQKDKEIRYTLSGNFF